VPEAHHEPGTVDPAQADPTARGVFVAGAISLLLLLVTLVGLEALHRRTYARVLERKVVEAQSHELRQLQSQQLSLLNGYRWVDRESGIVAIPIERAMELAVEEAHRTAPAGSAP
jgi:hypothetical protein